MAEAIALLIRNQASFMRKSLRPPWMNITGSWSRMCTLRTGSTRSLLIGTTLLSWGLRSQEGHWCDPSLSYPGRSDQAGRRPLQSYTAHAPGKEVVRSLDGLEALV